MACCGEFLPVCPGFKDIHNDKTVIVPDYSAVMSLRTCMLFSVFISSCPLSLIFSQFNLHKILWLFQSRLLICGTLLLIKSNLFV